MFRVDKFCSSIQGLGVLRKLIEVGAGKINESFAHPSVALLRLYPQVGLPECFVLEHFHHRERCQFFGY